MDIEENRIYDKFLKHGPIPYLLRVIRKDCRVYFGKVFSRIPISEVDFHALHLVKFAYEMNADRQIRRLLLTALFGIHRNHDLLPHDTFFSLLDADYYTVAFVYKQWFNENSYDGDTEVYLANFQVEKYDSIKDKPFPTLNELKLGELDEVFTPYFSPSNIPRIEQTIKFVEKNWPPSNDRDVWLEYCRLLIGQYVNIPLLRNLGDKTLAEIVAHVVASHAKTELCSKIIKSYTSYYLTRFSFYTTYAEQSHEAQLVAALMQRKWTGDTYFQIELRNKPKFVYGAYLAAALVKAGHSNFRVEITHAHEEKIVEQLGLEAKFECEEIANFRRAVQYYN